jgi:hypothetical protein
VHSFDSALAEIQTLGRKKSTSDVPNRAKSQGLLKKRASKPDLMKIEVNNTDTVCSDFGLCFYLYYLWVFYLLIYLFIYLPVLFVTL